LGTAGAAATAGAAGDLGAGGTPGVGGGAGVVTPLVALDMNDVTILVPLPAANGPPVLWRANDLADDGTAFVPRALYDHLTESTSALPILTPDIYERLQIVAVRFDLCDRHEPGACPATEDARMRLVFQPINQAGLSQDAGFHAFYAIRTDEIAGAVAALRALAALAPPQAGLLRVSPALTAADPAPYATMLRGFVKHYGGETRLVRLTMNPQPVSSAAIRWSFRGVERKGDAFADMTIAGTTATEQGVVLTGSPGFQATPDTDAPPGLSTAIAKTKFDAADVTEKREAVAALIAVENPLTSSAERVACVGCHVSTLLMPPRAWQIGVDPLALPGRYTSAFNLSTDGGKAANAPSSVRALGYMGKDPMISQRAVNETAQTLTEIAARYPAP
jgi:hypothetical protein